MFGGTRTIRSLLTFSAVIMLAQGLAVAAQPKTPKLPTLGDFDKAMAGERYGDAQQMAGVLLQTGGTAERAAVTLAYGRILLAQNDKKDFTEYRKNLRKLKLKGTDAALVEVYDAWAQAITKPTEADAAIKGLEEILGKNENCDATSEAADVLAQLYIARGDTADAKRVVEAGLKQFSGYQRRKRPTLTRSLRTVSRRS